MTETGETKIDAPVQKYWNSKKTPAVVGEQIKGVHIRKEIGEFKGKPTTQHVIMTDDGSEVYLPNHTVINGMMSRVPIGKVARVVYKGKGEASRGRSPPELYEVYMSDPTPTAEAKPTTPITDPSGALLADLKKAAGWEDNAFWDMVGNHVKTLGEGTQLVQKLKTEGRIVQDSKGIWKAV